jgi:hypothetical protein
VQKSAQEIYHCYLILAGKNLPEIVEDVGLAILDTAYLEQTNI